MSKKNKGYLLLDAMVSLFILTILVQICVHSVTKAISTKEEIKKIKQTIEDTYAYELYEIPTIIQE